MRRIDVDEAAKRFEGQNLSADISSPGSAARIAGSVTSFLKRNAMAVSAGVGMCALSVACLSCYNGGAMVGGGATPLPDILNSALGYIDHAMVKGFAHMVDAIKTVAQGPALDGKTVASTIPDAVHMDPKTRFLGGFLSGIAGSAAMLAGFKLSEMLDERTREDHGRNKFYAAKKDGEIVYLGVQRLSGTGRSNGEVVVKVYDKDPLRTAAEDIRPIGKFSVRDKVVGGNFMSAEVFAGKLMDEIGPGRVEMTGNWQGKVEGISSSHVSIETCIGRFVGEDLGGKVQYLGVRYSSENGYESFRGSDPKELKSTGTFNQTIDGAFSKFNRECPGATVYVPAPRAVADIGIPQAVAFSR